MSGKHSAGKGDLIRPYDADKFAQGWERAFGKKPEQEKTDERTPNQIKAHCDLCGLLHEDGKCCGDDEAPSGSD